MNEKKCHKKKNDDRSLQSILKNVLGKEKVNKEISFYP